MKMTLIPVIVCKILAVKVIVLIQIFTPEAAPRKYYFLGSSKKFYKIPRKHSKNVPCLLQLQIFGLNFTENELYN